MLDQRRFRKRYLYHLANHPTTLLPVAGGVAAITVGGLVLGSPLAVFAGIAATLGGVGAFLTRFLLRSDKAADRALRDLEDEAEQAREEALDDLERRLQADGDARTETLLRDLRNLASPFRNRKSVLQSIPPSVSFDIVSDVDELFRGCTQLLDQSLQLWHTTQGLCTPAAARPIRERREALIRKVGASVEQLGRVLATLSTLATSGVAEDAELERIRAELDTSLEVAREVDDQLRSIDDEGGVARRRSVSTTERESM